MLSLLTRRQLPAQALRESVPVFTGSSTLGSSAITQSGGNLGIGTPTPAFKLQVGAESGDGIMIGNFNDSLGWNGSGASPEYDIRFPTYRDVVSNIVGAKIAAIRTNGCCSALAQGMARVFYRKRRAGQLRGREPYGGYAVVWRQRRNWDLISGCNPRGKRQRKSSPLAVGRLSPLLMGAFRARRTRESPVVATMQNPLMR